MTRFPRECDPRFSPRVGVAGGIVTDLGIFPSEQAFRLWFRAVFCCGGV